MTPRWLMVVAFVVVVAMSVAVGSSVSSARVPPGQQPPTNDQQPTTNDHLPRPTFPAVVALLNDPARALAALDQALAARRDGPPMEALVLRAHLLSALHRYPESVKAWDEIARRDPDVAQFAGRSAISDLLAARDVDGAEPRIEAIVGARPRREHDLLLLSLADACQAAGRADRAAEIYKGIIDRERQTALADRARLGLAASEETAGHFDAALTALHQATITWRLADTFATARSEERRLAARLRRPATPLTAPQYLAIAARLEAASCFDDAVTLLEQATAQHLLSASDKVEAAIIDSLYRGRHNEAAMSRAGQFLARFPASRLCPSIRLLQVRLDIRTGNLARARSRMDSLAADARVPADVRRSAQRLVAANLVATGAARDGVAIYRRMIRGSIPRRERFDLYWRAGIACIRAGDRNAAIDMLRQARKYAPARSTPRSTLYWLAVATDQAGDAAEARRVWGQIVSENAFDYYGLRSAERLRTAGVALSASATGALLPATAGDDAAASPELRTAVVLARAGLADDAASMYRAAMVRFRTDAGVALLAARAAAAADDYATAYSIVSTRFGEWLAHPASGVSDVWQMAFPRAYWSDVEAAATRSVVDPLLLLSLMRRESRFVATARSRTGALGLFQIMPYTAREIAPPPEEPSEGDARLDAPASADLAAKLVKRILARFGGATAPSVAAYNAGEDRVADWWKASAGLAEDLFVDSIPYGETRQYVREVLANYAAYKRLYGGR